MKRLILIILLGILNSKASFSQKTFIESSGDVLQIAIPAIALGSTFLIKSDDKPHWQFIKSFATTSIVTMILKISINKERPNGGQYSFPSGHTSAAFTGAAFIQKRYGWEYGVPAYLLASYVGWSRIEAQKHYVSDVIAGALIGSISSYIFTKKLKKQQVTLSYLKLNPDEMGIGLSYHF